MACTTLLDPEADRGMIVVYRGPGHTIVQVTTCAALRRWGCGAEWPGVGDRAVSEYYLEKGHLFLIVDNQKRRKFFVHPATGLFLTEEGYNLGLADVLEDFPREVLEQLGDDWTLYLETLLAERPEEVGLDTAADALLLSRERPELAVGRIAELAETDRDAVAALFHAKPELFDKFAEILPRIGRPWTILRDLVHQFSGRLPDDKAAKLYSRVFRLARLQQFEQAQMVLDEILHLSPRFASDDDVIEAALVAFRTGLGFSLCAVPYRLAGIEETRPGILDAFLDRLAPQELDALAESLYGDPDDPTHALLYRKVLHRAQLACATDREKPGQ